MVREKSQDSEEGYDFSCPTAVDVTLRGAEPVFQIGAAVSNRPADSNQSAQDAIRSRCLGPQSRRLRRRDVRTDDGAHRIRGSRRSARLLALGQDVALVYPSASRVCTAPMIVVREVSEMAI